MKRKFCVFLPTYNNNKDLINFIKQILNFNSSNFNFCFYILNCNYGNSSNLRKKLSSITSDFKIFQLSANDYWGHCLYYITKLANKIPIIDSDIVYVANVDTLVLEDTILNVSKFIDKFKIISASYYQIENGSYDFVVNSVNHKNITNLNLKLGNLESLPILKRFSIEIEQPAYFNSVSKLAPTCGLFINGLTFLEAIKEIKNFSKFLPHYFSDYYFTYKLSKKLFNIYCFKSIMIIRFKNKKKYSRNPFSLLTPSYLPANIFFYNSIFPIYLAPLINFLIFKRFFKDLVYFLIFELFKNKR